MDKPKSSVKQTGDERVLNKEFLVFAKDRSWGPCPPEEKCSERIALYRSGRLVKDFIEIAIIPEADVLKIIDIIIKGNFITLRCPVAQVDDLRGSYTFGINEADTNTLEMPTCAELFKPVEDIVAPYLNV